MRNKKGLPALPRRQAGGRQAVVLLSGGLDSATTLYIVKDKGFICHCLIFDYGQRHRREIKSAKTIARLTGSAHQIIKIQLPWKGSSLLDRKIDIPLGARAQEHKSTRAQEHPVCPCPSGRRAAGRKSARAIPNTYVPARNIIFLSFALSYAEAIAAQAVFIGAHNQDYSGYPDCRPEFFNAFDKVVSCGTRAGAENRKIEIKAPLINKSKAQIIKIGRALGVPFELTWSCYRGGGSPCGTCDSCYFRAKGFIEAGIKDPLIKI